MDPTHLWEMPWDAVELLLSLFDPTLQTAVGEGVALVELQISFVGKEATSIFRQDISYSVCRHNCCREVNKVLPPWLKVDAFVSDHGELRRFSDEHLEATVLLVKAAKGHRVGVEVQGEP